MNADVEVLLAVAQETTTAIFTLAGALGGVVVSGAVTLVSSRWTAREARATDAAQRTFEAEKVRREAQKAAYAAYLGHAERAFRLAVQSARRTTGAVANCAPQPRRHSTRWWRPRWRYN